MLDELQRRNYAPITMKQYLRIIDEFAGYFDRPIEKLGPNHIRTYQAHLFRDRKLSSRTVRQHVAALRFLFVKTLKRAFMLEYIPFPKEERQLPIILSPDEVTRLIDASSSLMHRAMLMTLYATGLRRTEAATLKVADIDSKRMVIHVHEGKGRRDRDIPLSAKSVLLDSSAREILSAREGAGESLPRQVRRRPATIIWFRQAVLPWRTQGACRSATVPRVRPLAASHRLGGLCEEAIPRARACTAIPGPLHASGGHLKPPSGVL